MGPRTTATTQIPEADVPGSYTQARPQQWRTLLERTRAPVWDRQRRKLIAQSQGGTQALRAPAVGRVRVGCVTGEDKIHLNSSRLFAGPEWTAQTRLGRVCKLGLDGGGTGLSPVRHTTRLAEDLSNQLRSWTKTGPLRRSGSLQTRPSKPSSAPHPLNGIMRAACARPLPCACEAALL